ncbi:NAD(P)/FAD-dependent oxidoreductase [Formicincola oecophyllae]|uniref:Ferredoxin--NADP reductase n=1 Tax=Formicincola oecophyllae TaxID=2558361 RepID=A0A4Y6U9I7_9PROT|nr:NAD(P)/FAD-dependent oxidoreductase [Formicincola oecophyllae]QDH13690.1 NAD(P)/FAD-dependent oxidoreductase [Formicincola oecophyllae]
MSEHTQNAPQGSPRKLEADVAIVGAGPVGLFAAFQCGMLGLSCALADVLEVPGGQCVALYPEKPIYDIPSRPSITGGGLIEALLEQVSPFNPAMLLGSRISDVAGKAGAFTLTNERGDSIAAKAIIVAAGAGAFGPNRPPLEGLEAYESTGAVQYFVKKRADFADKTIVVAGGGDSALDWALSLSEIAKHVYLLHRRDRFRGAPDTLARIEKRISEGKIEKVVPYQLSALQGEEGHLRQVEVKTLKGEARLLDADHLLPFYGLSTDLGPIALWGFNTERSSVPVNPATMETTTPGIYAIGDVAHYPGKMKLILQGFSEAAMATHAAYAVARPDEALRFEHSSNRSSRPGA